MINRVIRRLGIVLCFSLLLASPGLQAQTSVIGTWVLDKSAVDSFVAAAEAAANTDEERAALKMMEPVLRKQAGKSALQFTDTELSQIRGAKSTSVEYQVVSVVDEQVTIAVRGKEFTMTVKADMMMIDFRGSGQPTPYRRLNPNEEVAFHEDLARRQELARTGPPADVEAEQRMMWVINAKPAMQKDYLSRHPDMLTLTDAQGSTLLHRAAGFGKLELIDLLVEKDVDVNVANKQKQTPLEDVLWRIEKRRDVADRLLAAGADLEHRGFADNTPLANAVWKKQLPTATWLLENGADPEAGVKAGEKTPFLQSVESGQVVMANLLLKHGANMRAPYDNGGDALHLAVKTSPPAMVQYLLNKGFDAARPNNQGWTPIALVRFRDDQHLAVAQMLVAAGADINKDNGWPLIAMAIEHQDAELVAGLIELGANTQATGTGGRTVLELARESGNADIVALLEASQ